ncbi:caspase family protein, partial [Desulfocicer niacini]
MANKAFLIGTNSLGLEYAENDLALMRQCLEKYDYGVLEVPSEAPIDKHGIQKCLDDFFDNCTKNDTVIVYFSGHADLDKGELFLIVGEKTRTDRIQFNRISESLRFCKAKNKLMVLDCCHAGSTIENRKISVSESFPILVAGERLEETRELDELKASFLTWHFHNALMSPPLDLLDKDGIIRPDSLANYLKRQGEIHNGRENADKIPIPYLNISTKSNFALADTRLIFNKIRECGTLFVECLGNDLSQIPPSNWPYTIQTALDRLRKYDRIHDYINLFEAFVHFHFVTLASQFYWCLSEEERKSPSEEIRPGLAMLRETLTCEKCCGGITWIDRSAILSKAAFHVKERLPFPELSDIFDAEQIHLSESSPTDSLWKENPLGCWQIKKAGTLWQCLSALAGLRKFVNTEIQDHKSNGDTEDILDDLCDAMGHIFRPCRNLQLAMISETQSGKERPQAGIHCCWEGTGFDCVTRKRSKNRLQTIWNRPSPKDMQILPAPDPPRSDWEWNESLIVFDPGDPYEKSVYLMPLGFRYSHNRSGESRDDGNEEKIPGLLDSVRWKGQKVSTVFQRTYSKKFREEDWQACKLPEQGAQVENLHRCIEQLCRGFTFEMPIPDTLPERPPRQFDLLHHEIADQLRENTVFRCEEIRRVMDLLTGSACRRLLLEGTSGSGKSVLLSQIYHQNRGRAVFVSNDMKVEPLEDPDFIDSALPENTASGDFEGKIGQRYSASETSKTSKSSVAIRVGMHILAVLGECMDYSPQKQELPARKIQDALRDMLSNYKNRHPEATFLVILDGLNQARDPGAMLGALPDPQPENLFVLVSSQKQERVKGPLTFYGKKRWEITNLTELQQAEAEKIIQQFWLREHKGNNAPKWEDLPQTLVRKLLDRSRYQPVFLRDWTERLKKSWHHDPERFWISAEADFDRNYKNLIPETLKRGFEEVKEDFDPPELLDALMWCFSLIPCALNRDELCRAIRILRQKGLLKDLPAVSALQISDALTKSLLGGFMRQMDTGLEQSYALAHEILGHQFCEYFLQLEQIPEFRLALVPMGAIPLPENAEEVEFDRWYQWIEEEDYEHYQLLEPISRISVCESLLARLDKNSSKYALVTSRLVQAFLSGTGEQERGFVLAPVLERAAETAHFPHRIRAEVLQSLGDILYKQQIIDIALEQYQRSLEM